jgi:site-specific recombinase XerD
MNKHRPKLTWATLNDRHLRNYINRLTRENLSAASINRKVACIRTFLEFLKNKGVVQTNAANRQRVFQRSATSMPHLTLDEVNDLLTHVGEASRDKRNRLIFLLLTIRKVHEIVDLNLEDAESGGLIEWWISQRPDQPQVQKVLELLPEYLETIRPKFVGARNENALFVSGMGMRLTRQQIWSNLKTKGKEAGLGSWVSSESMRQPLPKQPPKEVTALSA